MLTAGNPEHRSLVQWYNAQKYRITYHDHTDWNIAIKITANEYLFKVVKIDSKCLHNLNPWQPR